MSFDHTQLRASWAPGQRWETRVLEKVEHPQWVPVNGEPLWDERQEYRQVQPTAQALRVTWDEARHVCDLPEVDQAIRNLLEDHTGENATCMVRLVLEAGLTKRSGEPS